MALWEEIKSSITGLKDRILEEIRSYVVTTVAVEAAKTLVALLTPVGAIAKAVQLVFRVAVWLKERWGQIKAFVMSIYDTLADLAAGNFAKVTKSVEQAMAMSLPVLISLFAAGHVL